MGLGPRALEALLSKDNEVRMGKHWQLVQKTFTDYIEGSIPKDQYVIQLKACLSSPFALRLPQCVIHICHSIHRAPCLFPQTLVGCKKLLSVMRWHKSAVGLAWLANNGHTDAMVTIAHNLQTGQGSYPVDEERALSWFRRAAGLGHADAAVECSRIYREGVGVEVNDKMALRYLILGAKHESEKAQFHLAIQVYHGKSGTESDKKKAMRILGKMKHFPTSETPDELKAFFLDSIDKFGTFSHAALPPPTPGLSTASLAAAATAAAQRAADLAAAAAATANRAPACTTFATAGAETASVIAASTTAAAASVASSSDMKFDGVFDSTNINTLANAAMTLL